METLNPSVVLVLALAVAVVPIVIAMMTSFIKVSVVLGMLRSGLGAQQVPGNMVIMALSLSMTCYIMAPVISSSVPLFSQINLQKLGDSPTDQELEKITLAVAPWRGFLERHSGSREIASLEALSVDRETDTQAQHKSWAILIPAFVLSELKEAFAMAFVLLLPFLVIDLVVANILAGMGMYMVSPNMISLPIKLILFVSVDGWILLTRGMIMSYQ